jgi:hypothetical protein
LSIICTSPALLLSETRSSMTIIIVVVSMRFPARKLTSFFSSSSLATCRRQLQTQYLHTAKPVRWPSLVSVEVQLSSSHLYSLFSFRLLLESYQTCPAMQGIARYASAAVMFSSVLRSVFVTTSLPTEDRLVPCWEYFSYHPPALPACVFFSLF